MTLKTDDFDKQIDRAVANGKEADTRFGNLAKTIGGGVVKAAKIGATAIVASTTVAVGAITAITKKSVEAYANYEQLTGGISKLFGAA